MWISRIRRLVMMRTSRAAEELLAGHVLEEYCDMYDDSGLILGAQLCQRFSEVVMKSS